MAEPLNVAAVLDRAVCVVCHAGMGITQKALAHGVPVVAVPFGRDQPEVARRVEVAGAGVRLPASPIPHPGAAIFPRAAKGVWYNDGWNRYFFRPCGAREPQWLGTKYTTRRKGEAMKGG